MLVSSLRRVVTRVPTVPSYRAAAIRAMGSSPNVASNSNSPDYTATNSRAQGVHNTSLHKSPGADTPAGSAAPATDKGLSPGETAAAATNINQDDSTNMGAGEKTTSPKPSHDSGTKTPPPSKGISRKFHTSARASLPVVTNITSGSNATVTSASVASRQRAMPNSPATTTSSSITNSASSAPTGAIGISVGEGEPFIAPVTGASGRSPDRSNKLIPNPDNSSADDKNHDKPSQ